MKEATWDRLIGTIIDQASDQLREESDRLRELYSIRKRMRADNGQTRKKFTFPISLGAKISSERESDFEVTVQVSASAGRAASQTKDVHSPESEFFGAEAEAVIGNTLKAGGKARRKGQGKLEVEAGGETAVVDLATGDQERNLAELFLAAGVETGMEATITIIAPTIDREVEQKRHPAGFDFRWDLRLEAGAALYAYPDAELPDGRRSWPTAAAAMERAHYTLLSRLKWEGKTEDATIREACAKAIAHLLREWKRAESAIPGWGEVLTGQDEGDAPVVDLEAASQDLLTAGDLSGAPAKTPYRTGAKKAAKKSTKGGRGKPTQGKRAARK